MFCQDINEIKALIREWKQQGEKIVFTNGVFDILHLGHVDYLEKSKAVGSKLIVGINSDSSVKRLGKGDERPINPEFARATIVAALRCVDATILFAEDTPFDLIMEVMPDVLVKGGDYDPEEVDSSKKTYIVGSKEIKQAGGIIAAIPLVSGYSTTNIVRKLSK
jgi:rfaE bifunctional protein nucleotidyltransferase chain/domain